MGSHHFDHRVFVATTFFLISLASMSYGQGTGTSVGFYKKSCPYVNVESIVHDAISKHFLLDPTIAPALVRMHFHDCFVRGCDASILINGTNSEKTALPNLSLRGYEALDEAKANLESACPGVVSCADILALAARDSVGLTGGMWWPVPTGRRDGNVSLANNTNNLPAPTDSVATQLQKFKVLGLNAQDLVTLVGAHTIGSSACRFFKNRLYNYNSTGKPDPTMNTTLLATLQNICSPGNGTDSVRFGLDDTPFRFDNRYFGRLTQARGILESDQRLWADASTKPTVQRYLGPFGALVGLLVFNAEFPKSMVKMSNIGVLTGAQGEIRKVCSAVN